MKEKEDARLEMIPLRMEDSLDIASERLGTNVANSGTPHVSIGLERPHELHNIECGMGNKTEGLERLSSEAKSTSFISIGMDRSSVEKPDNVGGRDVTSREAVKEVVSRDLIRVQKAGTYDLISRDVTSSESRSSLIHNESVGKSVGLVSDEDFDREFGASASGQSTPKRRNGSRGRSIGTSRLENGVGGDSFTEAVLKGSSLDVLKANAVELSPISRTSIGGKDHGITFCDEVELPELRSSARNSLISTIVKTVFIILIWYTFSTCLTLYNKLLLGENLGKFPAPLLMNTIHFSMQAIISTLLVHFWCGRTQSHIRMTWRDYFTRVVPTAAATALDIDLSNISIVFISVSFATMVKSGAPVFLLLFAFAFKLEVPSFKLMGIIVVISLGVMLTGIFHRLLHFFEFISIFSINGHCVFLFQA